MKHRTSLRAGIATIISVLSLGSLHSFAATATTSYLHPAVPDVFLTEIQTSSTGSAGEEFVELYNNGTSDIDLADTAHAGKDAWKLQYFSGTKLAGLLPTANWASPTRTINLTGVVPAHDYYVLAGTGYNPGSLTPDQTYSATLADDAGAVQLIDSSTTGTNTVVTIHDQMAWSADKTLPANVVLNSPAGSGNSLQRLPNSDSQYVNSDATLTTFIADKRISPLNAWTPPAPAVPVDAVGGTSIGDGSTTPASDTTPVLPTAQDNAGLPAPIVTELLPNPAAPQTDQANEYIELYNPGDTAFNLNGYTLETGESTLHDFTFTTDVILAPQSYLAFYSADTNLSLSNSGGRARLLDKNGGLLGQSDVYAAASDGQAWALSPEDGAWHWTITPTPAAENLISLPAVKVSVVKAVATKKTTAKIKGASSTKKAKTVKKSTKKAKATKTPAATLAANTRVQPTAPIHPLVLAVVATLAVGYGVYEYRQDLANRLYQFRTDRAARRKARG